MIYWGVILKLNLPSEAEVHFISRCHLKRKTHLLSQIKAVNGKEAVEICKTNPDISIVLMDIKMPVMDGLEATALIKLFRKDLPIIAVTAYAMAEDEKIALDAGFDDYLPKPFTYSRLIEKVQKYTSET